MCATGPPDLEASAPCTISPAQNVCCSNSSFTPDFSPGDEARAHQGWGVGGGQGRTTLPTAKGKHIGVTD